MFEHHFTRSGAGQPPANAQPGLGSSEKDPLLQLPGAIQGRTPRGMKGKNDIKPGSPWRVTWTLLQATLIEWLTFTVVSVVFLFGYHQVPKILLSASAAIVVVCTVLALAFWNLGGHETRITHRKRATILGMVAFFTVAGSLAGISVYLSKCHDYWSFHTHRHYTNVSPDEPAAAHLDASAIVFMEGARPDVSRHMSYMRYKTIYCVAPIALDESYSNLVDTVSSDAQYWAAGKNCCGMGQGFTCGAVNKAHARGGLVISDLTGDDAFMKGVLSTNDNYNYEQAVLMAMAKFDMTSPDERIFVHFTEDLGGTVAAELSAAIQSWVGWVFTVFPLCLATGIVVVLVAADDHKEDMAHVKFNVFSTIARYK